MRIKHVIKLYIAAVVAVMVTGCSFSRPDAPQTALTEAELGLFPTPASVKLEGGWFLLNENTEITLNGESLKETLELCKSQLLPATGFTFTDASLFAYKNEITITEDKTLPKEGYRLTVTENQISIIAADSAGLYYAFQTVRQLLNDDIVKESVTDREWWIPTITIEDSPRFSWRGMHLDVSRHFFDKEEVKDFIDLISTYKINKLHMHLTDDQGWRIEIDKYPLLTEKGAWREHNKQDSTCIKRSKDDPAFAIPEKHYREINGKRMYGGFYTKDDMREMIAYAAERSIEIVPEIDVPGHFMAAIAHYPELSCKGTAGWGKVFSFPVCLGKDESYTFIENILAEVADLFPCEYLHIGGDEVNIKEWTQCPACQKAIKDRNLEDEHQLQASLNIRLEKFLAAKGKRIIGWDEVVKGGLSEDVTVMWWRNWAPKERYRAVDQGNDLIISPDFEYYFDFNPTATPLKKVYNYEPVPTDFTAEQEKHLIGIQANLWSERIPTVERLHFMAMPRMIAMAETAWMPKTETKDYNKFLSRLNRHFNRLDIMGVNYFTPGVDDVKKDKKKK